MKVIDTIEVEAGIDFVAFLQSFGITQEHAMEIREELRDADDVSEFTDGLKRIIPQIEDEYTEEEQESISLVRTIMTDIVESKIGKNRVYISDPSEAPEGINVQEGGRGGYYYETGDSGGMSSENIDEMSEDELEEFRDYLMDQHQAARDARDARGGRGTDTSEDDLMRDIMDVVMDVDTELMDRDGVKSLTKARRVYVRDPDNAPDAVIVHEGPRGGNFYYPEPEFVNLDPEQNVDRVVLEVLNEYSNVYGEGSLEDLDYWSSELISQYEDGEITEEVEGEFEVLEIGDSDDTSEAATVMNSIFTTFGLEGLERMNYWTSQIQDRDEEKQ